MIPILYEKTSVNFENNGIGHLKDAISCKVREKRHGLYELTLTYPITGRWFEEIKEGAVIKAKANDASYLQLFRIYKSSKPIDGIVTFNAYHISYDLKGYPLNKLSLTGVSAEEALTAGFESSYLNHRFTVWSNIDAKKDISFDHPRSLRNLCGGEKSSVLSIWGGELEFDNFCVKLHKARGADHGVIINYGKNLTDIRQERNINECYTHFCPYAVNYVQTLDDAGEIIEAYEDTVTLSEGIIELIDSEKIGHEKALILNITDKFAEGEEINEENLRLRANEYITSHDLGKPKINIRFSFLQLWDSPEYEDIAPLERVSICDIVTVRFPSLGIDAKAKIIETEYDSLSERYINIEVGDAKSTLADTVTSIEQSIADTQKSLSERENAASTALNKAIVDATNKITGNSGGYVRLYPPNNPRELIVMDSFDINDAVNVWRLNLSGFGHSKNGYNGPFGTAITMDGRIVADYITAGTLRSIEIESCTIKGGSLNINDKFTVDAEGNAHTEGYVKATSGIIGDCNIIGGKLQVPAAQITGTLTIGQLPETVAQKNNIPTKVSQLENDNSYATETGVTNIVKGTVTTDFVKALNVAAKVVEAGTGYIGGLNINNGGLFVENEYSTNNLFNRFSYVVKDGKIGFLTEGLIIGKTYNVKISPSVSWFKISNGPQGYASIDKTGASEFSFTMSRNSNIPSTEEQYIFISLSMSGEHPVFVSDASELDGYSIMITEEGTDPITLAFSNPGTIGNVGGLENRYMIYANGLFGISEDGVAVFGAKVENYVNQYMRFDPSDASLEILTSDGDSYTCLTRLSSGLSITKSDDITVSASFGVVARSDRYGVELNIDVLGDAAGLYMNIPTKYTNLYSYSGGMINLLSLLDDLTAQLP